MPVFRPKCRATANTFDAFREILRPKNGLRMTVQGTGLLPVIFSLVFPQLLSVMPKKSLFLSSQHCERIFPPEDLYCQSRPLYKFHFRIKRHVTIFVRPRLEIIVCFRWRIRPHQMALPCLSLPARESHATGRLTVYGHDLPARSQGF